MLTEKILAKSLERPFLLIRISYRFTNGRSISLSEIPMLQESLTKNRQKILI